MIRFRLRGVDAVTLRRRCFDGPSPINYDHLYVTRFWTPTVGVVPVAVLRQLHWELSSVMAQWSGRVRVPSSLSAMAAEIGVDVEEYRRAVHALVEVDLVAVQVDEPRGLVLWDRLPPLSDRMVRRLPPTRWAEHDQWGYHR